MNEPYPGGRGGGHQPHPGGRRRRDRWPNNDWYRPRRGQERGSDPREVSGERGGEDHRRHGGHRRPELDQTTVDWAAVDQTTVDWAVVDPTAALEPRGRKKGRNLSLINLDWTLISRKWALIAGAALFLIDTFLMADGFTRPVAMVSRILLIFIWLLSLAAVVVLWLRGSSRFSIQNLFVRAKTKPHQR
jgi:hypothetical protein